MTMQRMTRQRAAVADLLAATEDFRSAQQLHETLRNHGENIGLATVYRSLQALADSGAVDALRSDDGEVLYRKCETVKHHHHLVCRECGTTVEVRGESVERWADEVGREHGFTDLDHTIDLFGRCRDCSMRSQEHARGETRA